MLTRREFLSTSAAISASLVRPGPLAAAAYDLVVKGGRVLDAAQHMDQVADVAIRGGKIAAIQRNIAPSAATEVVDAKGKLVTAGLIDIHTHAAEKDLPPATCLADGVTALINAGSRGATNIDELVQVARSAPNHVRLLINIANRGITPEGRGELLDISSADAPAARSAIERQRDWIVGIKARLSSSVAGEHDLEAVRRARQVADSLKVPIMVHVGQTASPLPEIVKLLRPGDIVTHLYSPPPHGILDDSGRVLPEIREARRRGILFDVGNGRMGHITWEVAERALQQDFLPDTISSDLTAASRNYQVFNLPTVMSKFLMLGIPVDRVVACVTANAARAIPEFKNYGTLRPGAAADIAVLELQEGEFEFVDNQETKRTGRRKLVATATILAGKRV
ncbi:MAG TPA: amidohydrolase/deacetylase family metallohydrolase [Bryobacteraceae bacterium]|jgi:dihydroorotase